MRNKQKWENITAMKLRYGSSYKQAKGSIGYSSYKLHNLNMQ